MIKLIFWFAAAVSLGVAVFLPYVESRLLGSFNDNFHPEGEAQTQPVTFQLVCNYVLCGEPNERHLDLDFNDGFHPSVSLDNCPQVLNLGQAERRLGSFNDEFHPPQSGMYCLVLTPTPE